jgi:hypothetical protein
MPAPPVGKYKRNASQDQAIGMDLALACEFLRALEGALGTGPVRRLRGSMHEARERDMPSTMLVTLHQGSCLTP